MQHDGAWVPWSALPSVAESAGPRLDEPREIRLANCTILGGSGHPVAAGSEADIRFLVDGSVGIAAAGSAPLAIRPTEFMGLDISGPGAVATGGGFGFFFDDFDSFAGGLLASSVLNWLTTRTTIHTVLRIETSDGELFFHYGGQEPAALRIALSRVFMSKRNVASTTQARA